MLSRTHFAMSLLFLIILIPHVSSPVIFSIVFLVAGLLPDIDSPMSFFGKRKIFSPIQSLVNHRGMFHSITFAFIVALIISLVFPVLALGFFLGYALHLVADSFTIEGIAPFWPLGNRLSWRLKTGGIFEVIIFFVIIALDIILLLRYLS